MEEKFKWERASGWGLALLGILGFATIGAAAYGLMVNLLVIGILLLIIGPAGLCVLLDLASVGLKDFWRKKHDAAFVAYVEELREQSQREIDRMLHEEQQEAKAVKRGECWYGD